MRKLAPFAAAHRAAKHVGPGGIIRLPAPKIKSDLPKLTVDRSERPSELRGQGIVYERYTGPSPLKVEILRHTFIERKWMGKRAGSAQPIVNDRVEARRAAAHATATKWGVK